MNNDVLQCWDGISRPINRQLQNTITQKVLFNLASSLKPFCFNGEIPDMLFALGLLISGPNHVYDVQDVINECLAERTGITNVYSMIPKIESEHLDVDFCKDLVASINRSFIVKM